MTNYGTAPAPDYNPTSWKLGYQTSQFGVGQNPAYIPIGCNGGFPSSPLDAMSNPPVAMVNAAMEANPFQDDDQISGGTPSETPAWSTTGGTP